ncbi:MAG: 4Fe-4S dicluster domain-containing protein, partial [Acidobacteriota bacterium]
IMEDLEFTPEERRDLKLGEELSLAGVFCQHCSWCAPQCPAGMDVPTWMRASMYALGHGSVDKAKETLRQQEAAALPCAHCSRCAVQCALGLDVRANALELADLLDIRA